MLVTTCCFPRGVSGLPGAETGRFRPESHIRDAVDRARHHSLTSAVLWPRQRKSLFLTSVHRYRRRLTAHDIWWPLEAFLSSTSI